MVEVTIDCGTAFSASDIFCRTFGDSSMDRTSVFSTPYARSMKRTPDLQVWTAFATLATGEADPLSLLAALAEEAMAQHSRDSCGDSVALVAPQRGPRGAAGANAGAPLTARQILRGPPCLPEDAELAKMAGNLAPAKGAGNSPALHR